ncbi:hypothetical protein AVEN_121352-1 [Araneus ventricosus]|uniref:Uncharacterized protein n=1 Tax=Araneus ventricosus TaxID=182803 RepID=A0A4Y2TYB3_ARAVE|nr:hypothetical protein AVEN_121352-1 [Araneus ventricosus]
MPGESRHAKQPNIYFSRPEKMGQPFTAAAGPRERLGARVRVWPACSSAWLSWFLRCDLSRQLLGDSARVVQHLQRVNHGAGRAARLSLTIRYLRPGLSIRQGQGPNAFHQQ